MDKSNKKLREQRLLKQLTQDNIAIDLEMTQKSYSKLENGKVCLTTEKIEKISDILKVNPSQICNLSCQCTEISEKLQKTKNFLIENSIEIPDFLI